MWRRWAGPELTTVPANRKVHLWGPSGTQAGWNWASASPGSSLTKGSLHFSYWMLLFCFLLIQILWNPVFFPSSLVFISLHPVCHAASSLKFIIFITSDDNQQVENTDVPVPAKSLNGMAPKESQGTSGPPLSGGSLLLSANTL